MNEAQTLLDASKALRGMLIAAGAVPVAEFGTPAFKARVAAQLAADALDRLIVRAAQPVLADTLSPAQLTDVRDWLLHPAEGAGLRLVGSAGA